MHLVTDPHGHANDTTSVPCLRCRQLVRLSEAVIDLDGPPFEAYYHTPCAPGTGPYPIITEDPTR